MNKIYLDQYFGIKILNPMEIVKMDTTLVDCGKPLVIYHGNCADGFSAAWCFHHYAKINESRGFDFHPGVYNNPPPDVTGRIVYLVDFSYKRDVVEEMLNVAAKVILIDHHKTAIDDLIHNVNGGTTMALGPNFEAYVDLERSGARLAWDYLFNREPLDEAGIATGTINPDDPMYKQPPLLLGHVEDRDLWRFKLPLTREIQANLFSYEYTFENWDKLMLETSTLTLAEGGTAIERKHFKDIKELLNVTTRYVFLAGHHIPVANLPYTFASDAGHIMAKEWQEGSLFAATYYDTNEHRIFSLRSTPDGIDVSEVAKQYGGGGHRNASGFRVPRDHDLARF